jgi:tRNA(adenine34) deaminase
MTPDKRFMTAAIAEALKSKAAGDYAVGSVIVCDNKVVARAGNRTQLDNDPTNHAEMIAIREAAKQLGTKNLSSCVIYSTHEPCPMCAAAIYWARISGIVFGAKVEDMTEFRKTHANERWKWRTIELKAREILEKVESRPFIVEEFMRDECLRLFHS